MKLYSNQPVTIQTDTVPNFQGSIFLIINHEQT
jgi:hypothetical protein